MFSSFRNLYERTYVFKGNFILLFAVLLPSGQVTACNNATEFQCVSNQKCIRNSLTCDNWLDCVTDDSDENWNLCRNNPANMSTILICSVKDQTANLLYKIYGNPAEYINVITPPQSQFPPRQGLIRVQKINLSWPINALDVDYRDTSVYFVNYSGQLGYSTLVFGRDMTFSTFPEPPPSKTIPSIAFDWISKILYWIDSSYKHIALSTKSPEPFWKPIVTNLTSPQRIAIDPVNGYLFWTDAGSRPGNGCLERSDLAGNNRIVLVSDLNVPTALVVDFTFNRVYVLDTGVLDTGVLVSVNFSGGDLQNWTIPDGYNMMAINKQYLFFGTKGGQISIYSKLVREITNFSITDRELLDIAVFTKENQPTTTGPCDTANGGCDQVCLKTSTTTRQCSCSLGYYMASDKTCATGFSATDTKSLLVADYSQWNIFQLNPSVGELHALPASSSGKHYFIKNPVALVADSDARVVYFGIHDGDVYSIYMKTMDGLTETLLYTLPAGGELENLAVDVTHGFLYYTDTANGVIGELPVSSQKSSVHRAVINSTAERPYALSVDCDNRLLYWSDCPINRATTIQSMSVNGELRKTLVSITDQDCITAIVIDSGTIYWTTTGRSTLQSSSLSGANVNILYVDPHDSDVSSDYRGLALLDKSLYIADTTRRDILKVYPSSRTAIPQRPSQFTQPRNIVSFVLPSASSKSSDKKHNDIIIGLTVGLGALLVVIVVGVVVYRYREKCDRCRKQQPAPTQQQQPPNTPANQDVPLQTRQQKSLTATGSSGSRDDPENLKKQQPVITAAEDGSSTALTKPQPTNPPDNPVTPNLR